MSLKDKAMLVSLSVAGWTARKLDRKVTNEVDVAHNARDAGRYNKLLVDKQHLDPLTQHASAIRAYHHKTTLPWLDGGARLLPSRLFMEYSKEMRSLKSEYERRVSDFIALYDSKLVADARSRLGTMYDPKDYPPGHDLRSKFGIELDIMPVPDGDDFRVTAVADDERKRVSEEINRKREEREQAAMKEAWSRVREVVDRYTRIGGDKAKIYDSMVENAEELTRLLPGLNIHDDPQMDAVCQAVLDKLLVNPDRLRRSAVARKQVVADAHGILAMCP